MKKVMVISFVVLSAAALAVGESGKIGVVDLQKAFMTVESGKSVKTTLEKEAAAKKAELDKKQQTLQKEWEEFEKKAAILNDSAKAQKQAEMQKKFVDIQKAAQETQVAFAKRERDLTEPVLTELTQILEGIGKDKSLAFIVEKKEGGVLYSEAGSDVTDELIERYNKRNKGKKK